MRRTRGFFGGGRTLARVRVAGAWIGLAALVGGVAQTAAAGAPSVMSSVRFHHGSLDLGDPLVPGYGNGGYRVSHYGSP